MTSTFSQITPLLIAFIGASFGAYFAILKTKRETLWKERYETLLQIVNSVDTIRAQYEVSHMQEMGVPVMGKTEKEKLTEDLLQAKSDLRANIAKLSFLFKEKDISSLYASYIDLNSSFQELFCLHPSEYVADYLQDVATNAEVLHKHAIKLGGAKCL